MKAQCKLLTTTSWGEGPKYNVKDRKCATRIKKTTVKNMGPHYTVDRWAQIVEHIDRGTTEREEVCV